MLKSNLFGKQQSDFLPHCPFPIPNYVGIGRDVVGEHLIGIGIILNYSFAVVVNDGSNNDSFEFL